MDLVSIVIPCTNPDDTLLETVASARAQRYRDVELVIVDDGTQSGESLELLNRLTKQTDRHIIRANHGSSATRNAGFNASSGELIVTLNCGAVLHRDYVATCIQALRDFPKAGFVYTDYRVFGRWSCTRRLPNYNLHELLDDNVIPRVALIRKDAWELAGGYDESLDAGYEDWDFWLRLAAKRRFGHHVSKTLFRRRERDATGARAVNVDHPELGSRMRAKHPEFYSYEARARIKAEWSPVVCIAGGRPAVEQTIQDWEATEGSRPREVLKDSRAEAILFSPGGSIDRHSAEYAALAVWGGKDRLNLADGSVVCSRRTLERCRNSRDLEPEPVYPANDTAPGSAMWRLLPAGERVHRHLENAELSSAEAWVSHPLRSAARLIPLRIKEGVNHLARRTVFDLSFYLQFQPKSLGWEKPSGALLRYMPKLGLRERVALVAPHLGPGGAETVLLEIASALDRDRHEVFFIATQSRDPRWSSKWKERADHVYDLTSLVNPEMARLALDSIVTNWAIQTVLIQSSLSAYSLIPRWKRALPGIRVMDLIHAVGSDWDVPSATAEVADGIDLRIVESEEARTRLKALGTGPERIRLIRHGIDLRHFAPRRAQHNGVHRILFVGRLDPVKRPQLLVEIARALLASRPASDFRFTVVGDGPESAILPEKIKRAGVEHLFELRGRVPDVAPLLADSDLVLIPSKNEGIPLVLLEAFASGRPVVASRVGAIKEVLDDCTGVTIAPTSDEAVAFAAAINTLLDQPEVRCRMGMAARRKVETEFDRDSARVLYRDLFS